MINAFLNQVKAKLALIVKKSALELIFFIELDRFAILLSILSLLMLPPTSVLSLFLFALVQAGLAEIDGAVVSNIEVNGAAILLKPLINRL